MEKTPINVEQLEAEIEPFALEAVQAVRNALREHLIGKAAAFYFVALLPMKEEHINDQESPLITSCEGHFAVNKDHDAFDLISRQLSSELQNASEECLCVDGLPKGEQANKIPFRHREE